MWIDELKDLQWIFPSKPSCDLTLTHKDEPRRPLLKRPRHVAPADRRYSGVREGSHHTSVSHAMWSTAVLGIAEGSCPQSPLKVPCKKIALLRNAVRIRSEIIGPSD